MRKNGCKAFGQEGKGRENGWRPVIFLSGPTKSYCLQNRENIRERTCMYCEKTIWSSASSLPLLLFSFLLLFFFFFFFFLFTFDSFSFLHFFFTHSYFLSLILSLFSFFFTFSFFEFKDMFEFFGTWLWLINI